MSATDIATSVDVDLDLIYEQTKAIAEELINTAAMKPGQILVVGCPRDRLLLQQRSRTGCLYRPFPCDKETRSLPRRPVL